MYDAHDLYHQVRTLGDGGNKNPSKKRNKQNEDIIGEYAVLMKTSILSIHSKA